MPLTLSSHIVSPRRCSALMEGLVTPLQDRIEEWKKTANQLDKDHAKGEQPGNTNYKYSFVSTEYIGQKLMHLFSNRSSQNTRGLVRKSKGSR